MKKYVITLLSLALLFSLATTAFAANPDNDQLLKARQAADQVLGRMSASSAAPVVSVVKDKELNDAPSFYASIAGKSYDQLTNKEMKKFLTLTKKAAQYYNSIDAAVNGEMSASYFESQLSKAIEAAVYVGFPTLSTSEIATSLSNSNTARDIGTSYASLNGWSQTWDNPADAYRHFAWNYLNTKDINANDARVFGDYHELALAASIDANNQTALSFDQKVVYGVARVFTIRSNVQSTLAKFNAQFDSSSVMDIYNNSWGRKYAVNYNYPNVGDAFYAAFFTNDVLIGYTSEVTSSIRSTAFSYFS